MKVLFYFVSLLLINTSFAQTSFVSKTCGLLEFKELDHGLGQTVERTLVNEKNSPTGTRGWLEDYWIIEVTDSIRAVPKANFGVVYIVHAKDSV
ncbi:MAG: hypothetical protein ACXWFZ_13270, partial [Nitrososphaeraceae archaeon]